LTSLLSLSAEASSPSALLAPLGHRSGGLGSGVGPAVRAAGSPPPGNTEFCRESFGPYEPAQHYGQHLGVTAAAADLLRPSAEEASPDKQTSDALCRSTGAKLRAPRKALPAHAASLRDVHRKRRARAARNRNRPGWFRTMAIAKPERLPLDRSSILRSKQAGPRSL
jgi:hypothetical protein